MTLERELAVYHRMLPELLGKGLAGKFVLIHGDDLVGVSDTREEAIQHGCERTLRDSFLTKQIAEKEEPKYFSRNIKPCPS